MPVMFRESISGPSARISSQPATLSARRRCRRLAESVAGCDDIRALGPLIDSLNITGMRVRNAVCETVTQMLARLDPATAEKLTSDQVGMLNYQLRRAAMDPLWYSSGLDGMAVPGHPGNHSTGRSLPQWRRHSANQERIHPLLVAIINAAPQFGDRETLKQLERLARMQV